MNVEVTYTIEIDEREKSVIVRALEHYRRSVRNIKQNPKHPFDIRLDNIISSFNEAIGKL